MPSGSATNKTERERRFTFLVCGGTTTLTAAGVWFLVFWICANEDLALVLDYVWGTFLGYTLNRRFTFGDRNVHGRKSFAKYTLSTCVYFAVHWVLMKPLLIIGFGMNKPLAFVISFAAALVLFYSAQKAWVFKHEPAS